MLAMLARQPTGAKIDENLVLGQVPRTVLSGHRSILIGNFDLAGCI